MATNIKIGIVNIPCMMINTINQRDTSIHLNQVHKEDGGKVGYTKYCKDCGKQLLAHEIGKSYKDKVLEDDDLDRIKDFLENQTIEILGFSSVDVAKKKRFIYANYYILNDISKTAKKSQQKTFIAFIKALESKDLVAVCKYTSRGKQHLGFLYVDFDNRVLLSLFPYNRAINEDITRLEDV